MHPVLTCGHEETGHEGPGQGCFTDAGAREGRQEVRQEDAERAAQPVHQRVTKETDGDDHPAVPAVRWQH